MPIAEADETHIAGAVRGGRLTSQRQRGLYNSSWKCTEQPAASNLTGEFLPLPANHPHHGHTSSGLIPRRLHVDRGKKWSRIEIKPTDIQTILLSSYRPMFHILRLRGAQGRQVIRPKWDGHRAMHNEALVASWVAGPYNSPWLLALH